jgi:hypothetical protein
MKIKYLLLSLALMFAGVLAAQITSYSTPAFSATFNGPVTFVPVQRNTENTSTDNVYLSVANSTAEIVNIRYIDSTIPTDFTSSDYYANKDAMGGMVLPGRTQGRYPCPGNIQGCPFTYIHVAYTSGGAVHWRRIRFIIVSAHEVIFMKMESPAVAFNGSEWTRFVNSLVIK